MAYDLIKISALPAATPDESQEIVVGVGDLAKRINYGDVKADMVGISPSYTTDTEPYLMRRTAHTGVVGKCALNKLVGGSLGWNQLVQNGNFASTSNWTAAYGGFTVSGNVATITATAQWGRIAQNVSVLSGHKYLFSADLKGTTNNYAQFGTSQYLSGTAWEHISFLYSATSTTTVQLMIGDKSTSGWQAFNAQNVQVFDLTAMFGSTIADYVYGLGSTNGIAWLSKYIDLSTYHAYDAGSIQNVQATEHVTLSKNFLTDFNHSSVSEVMNGITFTKNSDGTITLNGTASAATTYYLSSRSVLPTTVGLRVPKGSFILSGTPTGYSSYNLRLGMNRGADGATIGNDTGSGFAFTEPEGTAVTYGVWIGFNSGAVFNNVVIKPMVRYADADSTYEPYQKHTYPLGSDTLRGIPQLVSNKLQFDGDEKYPDGTIRRKYGIVDLGTLTYTGDSGGFVLSASIGAKVQTTQSVMAKLICSKYPTIMQSQLSGSDKCVYGLNWGNGIGIRDSAYSTPAAFKTAMSGVYLVYELATETTESSTSYQKVQTIDADGTESFTSSSPVPVGHETQTPDNILAALNWLGE